MTKKKNALLSERVIRRWGKLANMPALTENWLEEQDALEDEEAAAEDEIGAGEAEIEAGEEAEASVEEEEAVERIVTAVVDAIADETGVAIEVEGDEGDEAAEDELDAGMDVSDELDDAADEEMDLGDEAANRRAYNRSDIQELSGGRGKIEPSGAGAGVGYQRDDKPNTAKKEKPGEDKRKGAEKRGAEGTKKKTSGKGRGEKKGDDAYANNRKDETLNLEVIDDEQLTEAVLKRVVERLLRRK
jgi:microcompartment protein CcmK/EutM